MNKSQQQFLNAISQAGREACNIAQDHGFWPSVPPEFEKFRMGNQIALMHTELSEALEAIRKPHRDEHCPEFENHVVELADVVLRVLQYSHHYSLPLGEAILAKMEFNAQRPYLHGGKTS